MSNESSASETTPLRRPERQNCVDVSLSSPFLPVTTRDVCNNNNNAITKQHQSHNSSSNAIGNISNSVPPVTATTAAFSSTSASTSSSSVAITTCNNNNHIEVRLSGGATNIGKTGQNLMRMDTNKRILSRVAIDVLILLCVGFPILCFFLWGESYKRGFFCDDESLKHPFKDSTIRNWMLYIIGLIIPIGLILTVEIIKSKHNEQKSNGNTATRRYVFMEYEIPEWLVECYKKIGIFGFGAAVSQLTTDIAKYSIGRLRPHFFAVCKPIMSDNTTCDDPINAGKYIEEFRCEGGDSTQRMLKEARLSFPSGHSSFTFYTMVYLALYLQSRMDWRGSKLLRHFLQFLFIMIAWYTALSRVSDYKHHWSDVLAGSLIGSLTALIVANYVSDLFQGKSNKLNLLPHTRQDTQPIASNGH